MSKTKTPAKKTAAKKSSSKKVGAAPAVVVKKNAAVAPKIVIDIEVKTKGETFKGKVAPDAISAFIEGLGISSTNTRTVITAKYGKKKVIKTFNVFVMRRLLRQSLPRVVLQKNITVALGL